MPRYKSHLLIGLITFALLIYLLINFFNINFNNNYLGLYLFLTLLGSLFPDIDTKSKIQKYFYIFLFLLLPITLYLKNYFLSIILTFLIIVPLIFDHRTITHSIYFILLIPVILPILIYLNYYQFFKISLFGYIFFVLGAISHILLDFLQTSIKKIFK